MAPAARVFVHDANENLFVLLRREVHDHRQHRLVIAPARGEEDFAVSLRHQLDARLGQAAAADEKRAPRLRDLERRAGERAHRQVLELLVAAEPEVADVVRNLALAELAVLVDGAFDWLAFRNIAGRDPIAQVARLEVGVERLAVRADGQDAAAGQRRIGLGIHGRGGGGRSGADDDIGSLDRVLAGVGEEHLGLRLLPFLRRYLLRLIAEDERALLVADNKVRPAIAVHVRDADLPAHAGVVVNEVRHPVHGLVGVAREAEPVEHRRVRRAGVGTGTVRPEALAGDDVLQPVAVHVHQLDGVQLRESDAVAVLAGFLVHEDVGLELNLAVGIALLELLIPREAVAVRRERGDDVRQAVAVHVIGIHLRAARGEEGLVELPRC